MKDVMHHWLPDRHLGVAATLSRSDELIGQVANLLFNHQTQPGDVFHLAEVPAGPFSRSVIERTAPIPRKVPLRVADALAALRVGLEHALFAEVEFLDGSPLEEKAAKLVDMLASDTYEKSQEWKKRREAGPAVIAGWQRARAADRRPTALAVATAPPRPSTRSAPRGVL